MLEECPHLVQELPSLAAAHLLLLLVLVLHLLLLLLLVFVVLVCWVAVGGASSLGAG